MWKGVERCGRVWKVGRMKPCSTGPLRGCECGVEGCGREDGTKRDGSEGVRGERCERCERCGMKDRSLLADVVSFVWEGVWKQLGRVCTSVEIVWEGDAV